MQHTYVLTLSCQDRPGIVHAVSGFLLERGGNIEEAAQFNDHGTGLFFMRVQFTCDDAAPDALRDALAAFATPFGMRWKLHAFNRTLKGFFKSNINFTVKILASHRTLLMACM